MLTWLLTTVLFAAPGSAAPATAARPAATAPAAASAGARLDLAGVIARVQKRYDEVKSFRASFSQKYSRAVVGRTSVSTGQLAFKKPGRMRWDYEKPEARMFLAAGETLWLYEPEEKQAFKQGLKSSQLPAALAFLMGKGRITDQFEVSFSDDAQASSAADYRLRLLPKEPQSTYKSIVFVVDAREFAVRESVLVHQQGNVNHFVFSDLKINADVADKVFMWTPPAGVRVIDTAKLGK